MPVNHHSGSAGPPRGPEQEDIVMFLLEVTWWAHHVLTNLIFGGVLERHPDLQFVFTEQGTAWVPDFLGSLDYFFDRMRNAVGSQEREWGLPIVEKLSLKPSEYWARQCHVGASFIRRPRCRSASRSASTGSCGAATTRTRSRATRSRRRRSGSASPASTRRGADDARRQRGRALRLRPRRARARSARRSGPSSGRSPGRCRRPTSPRGRRSARRSRIPRSPCSEHFDDTRGDHMSVDIRSRVDGEVDSVDPRRCFGEVLPEAFERHQRPARRRGRACSRPRRWSSRSTATRGRSRSTAASCTCATGGDDDARRRCCGRTAAQLDDLVNDQVTVVGMQTNGTLDQPVGRFDALLDWWLLLRGALDARAPHVPGAIDLVDADGAPLALDRSFPADAPLDEMGDFLQRAGLPPHRGRVRPRTRWPRCRSTWTAPRRCTRRDDGRSWWARNRDGDELLVRMQYFDEVSPAVERLVRDERLQRLAGPHRRRPRVRQHGATTASRRCSSRSTWSRGSPTCPWHKDCALGRHSYDCCSMTVGISVTGADARVGPAARGRGLAPRAHVAVADHREDRSDLPAVDLPTRTGDVTVHLSCTLHKSQPPVERERRVLYTGFRLPLRGTDAEREARERLRAIREDAPVKAPQRQPADRRSSRASVSRPPHTHATLTDVRGGRSTVPRPWI